MLQIKRLSGGKTWNVPSQIPEVAEVLGIPMPDTNRYYGLRIEVAGDRPTEYSIVWNGDFDEILETLDPELYSVTDTDSLPREEVRRALDELLVKWGTTVTLPVSIESQAMAQHIFQAASALNIPLSPAEGEAKEARV